MFQIHGKQGYSMANLITSHGVAEYIIMFIFSQNNNSKLYSYSSGTGVIKFKGLH